MRYLLLTLCIFITAQTYAQRKGIDPKTIYIGQPGDSIEKADTVYLEADQMPVAGYDVQKYLATHIKYPERLRKEKREGHIYVRFVVNADGHISGCTAIKGESPFRQEAFRVVHSMPAWQPGQVNGKAVRVRQDVRVTFSLKR